MVEYVLYFVLFAAPFPSLVTGLLEFTDLHIVVTVILAFLVSPTFSVYIIFQTIELVKKIPNHKVRDRIAPFPLLLFFAPIILTSVVASQFLTRDQPELESSVLAFFSIVLGIGLLLLGILIIVVLGLVILLIIRLGDYISDRLN